MIAGSKWWVNKANKQDLYIEGRNGYATGDGKKFWVTITVPKHMLRTPDFTDMGTEQTLACTLATLKPLLEIIKPYVDHPKVILNSGYRANQSTLENVETIE